MTEPPPEPLLELPVKLLLAGVAERRVAEIVSEPDRLDEVLVQAERPPNAARDPVVSTVCVIRVRKWSPPGSMNTCVLFRSRRKAFECTIRSRSR